MYLETQQSSWQAKKKIKKFINFHSSKKQKSKEAEKPSNSKKSCNNFALYNFITEIAFMIYFHTFLSLMLSS